jgi:EAL domain-containing protein (putative c-di-GMP-specific phosphodiesterase class I)
MLLKYRLEKIVALNKRKKIKLSELLCRPNPNEKNIKNWENWYSSLPGLLADIFRRQKLDYVTVNVDAEQIHNPVIFHSLTQCVQFPMILEWTEKTFQAGMYDISETAERFKYFQKKFRTKIFLDDIGSGIDGFGRACQLKPDAVKLDGDIFQMSMSDYFVRDLIKSYIKTYKHMKIPVIIEWIETKKDLRLAKYLGGDFGQGYYWTPKNKLDCFQHYKL